MQRSACLCLLNAGIKSIHCHYHLVITAFKKDFGGWKGGSVSHLLAMQTLELGFDPQIHEVGELHNPSTGVVEKAPRVH